MTARKLHVVALDLEPSRLLSGWHPERAALFIPALSDAPIGADAAVRIGIAGTALQATVVGRIVLVRRLGRPALPPGVEIAVDRDSMAAMRFLARAAAGEALPYRAREPRWVFPVRIPVTRAATERECITRDVSEGGCSLAWPGEDVPRIGAEMELRVRHALFASTIRGVVCWTSRPSMPGPARLGLRLVGEGRGARAWRAIVTEASRSGAGA